MDSIEKKLRPGGSSLLGFLGFDESLSAVVEQDQQTLANLGVTHEQVATALDDLIASIGRIRHDLLAKAEGPSGEYFRRTRVPWFNPYDLTSLPVFSTSNLPDAGTGYLLGGLHVFVCQLRGLQECPWGCELDSTDSSVNFLVLDRKTSEHFTFPGLSPHLIRVHQFFEGFATPFRTDPVRATRVLGLV